MEDGVQTFDISMRENFQLREALMWIINDFLAYSIMLGWSTSGVHTCSYCMEDSKVVYFKHGRKVFFFTLIEDF